MGSVAENKEDAMTRTMTSMTIAGVCLTLGACGPVTIATTVINGMSYAQSGKSVTEHALDALDKETCLLEALRAHDQRKREECADVQHVRPAFAAAQPVEAKQADAQPRPRRLGMAAGSTARGEVAALGWAGVDSW